MIQLSFYQVGLFLFIPIFTLVTLMSMCKREGTGRKREGRGRGGEGKLRGRVERVRKGKGGRGGEGKE